MIIRYPRYLYVVFTNLMPKWVDLFLLRSVRLPDVSGSVKGVPQPVALLLNRLVLAVGVNGVLQVRVDQQPGQRSLDDTGRVRLDLVWVRAIGFHL